MITNGYKASTSAAIFAIGAKGFPNVGFVPLWNAPILSRRRH